MSSRKIFKPNQIEQAIIKIDKNLGKQESSAKQYDDVRKIREVRAKRKLIADLQNETRNILGEERSIFISYPARMQEDTETIRKLAIENFGFKHVYTGFDEEVRKTPNNLRTGIMYKIREASCLLGIWSDDIPVMRNDSSKNASAPGVWMPIELGMALAMEKPVRLLVHDDLHRRFISPVTDFHCFSFRDQRSLDRVAAEALTALFENIRLSEEESEN